ncbi:unnamed protein product [Rotaria sp. Silwood2]|nr:unnamed protein product [Rotaria sp. Silwood2]
MLYLEWNLYIRLPLLNHSSEEWTFVDVLTTFNVMPVLRRMNFSIVIDVNDLDQMTQSPLFNDDRHIDVHYAFVIHDN